MYPLKCQHLKRTFKKGFGNLDALNDFNLEVKKGEVVGLLGPNGAGKTTFLNCAIGLLEPNKGTLEVFGKEPFTMESIDRAKFGYDGEGIVFPLNFNVRKVLDFVKSTYPVWNKKREKDLLDKFKLLPIDIVSALSRGNQRKLGLITAVCHDPELIFLDESLSNFDIDSRLAALDLIGELSAEGRSILFASHIHADVERIADKIVIMEKGVDVLSGSMEDLKETCLIIRTENLKRLPGKVKKIEQDQYFITETSREEIEKWQKVNDPQADILGVNLEKIYLATTSGDNSQNGIS